MIRPWQASCLYTYSKRISWSSTSNLFSALKHSRLEAGLPVTDLTISNPVAAGLEYPHARLAEILASVRDFSYTPHPLGDIGARTAIASFYAREGIVVQPDQLCLTASSSEAYSVLFKLLCDPGDEILVPTPSYPLFEYLAALDSVRVAPYRLLYAGSWFVDLEHLKSLISARTRAIIVVNPNNPTGSFLKRAEYEALCELAENRRLPLISDEVFRAYRFRPDAAIVPTLAGRQSGLSFLLDGLSKAAGMPQLKLGWISIHGGRLETAEAAQRIEHILDTYLSVGTPVQRALPDLLGEGLLIQGQIQHRINSNLALVRELLEGSPADSLHVEGGWSSILQIPATRTEDDWVTTLLGDYGVAVQPGYFFDLPREAYVVVSLLTPPAVLRTGLASLLEMIRHE